MFGKDKLKLILCMEKVKNQNMYYVIFLVFTLQMCPIGVGLGY